MAIEIKMPKMGLTMTTGTVVKWHKEVGDSVKKGETIVEVSTEKINNEVEATADGILLKIVASEGTELPVGAIMGYIGQQGETITNHLSAMPETVIKEIPIESMKISNIEIKQSEKKVAITPVAKILAIKNNIDYTMIEGTGPGGRITKEDIQQAIEQGSKVTVDLPKEIPASSHSISQEQKTIQVIPYSGMRKAIGVNMSKSWTIVPKVTLQVSADALRLLELRKNINTSLQESSKISITDLLVKLAAKTISEKRFINAKIEDESIKILRDINIGIAVALEKGLVVPVIKNADQKTLKEISKESKELIQKARDNRLSPDELTGGTFTITNLGSYRSVDHFTPIINHPEAAILGIGRIVDTPVAVDGQIAIRPMMGLSLAFDHRIIDGAPAAEFLALIIKHIENPYLLFV